MATSAAWSSPRSAVRAVKPTRSVNRNVCPGSTYRRVFGYSAVCQGIGVGRPGRSGGVLPRPRRGIRRRAAGALGGRDEARDVARGGERRAGLEDPAQGRDVAGDDGRVAGQRLDRRQAEALVVGGEDERAGAAVDRREVIVVDAAGEDDPGELLGPRARRAGEDERQPPWRGDEL